MADTAKKASKKAETSNEVFNKAANDDVQNLKSKPGPDDLLKLYGLFKVAVGDDISKETAPGMFEFQRKAMRSEWQKVVDKGLTAEAAQEEYIKAVRDLEESIGIKE